MGDTKKCPHCGEEIKANAKKCRFCGEWLDSLTAKPTEDTTAKQTEDNKRKTWLYVAITAVVIFIGSISAYFLFFAQEEITNTPKCLISLNKMNQEDVIKQLKADGWSRVGVLGSDSNPFGHFYKRADSDTEIYVYKDVPDNPFRSGVGIVSFETRSEELYNQWRKDLEDMGFKFKDESKYEGTKVFVGKSDSESAPVITLSSTMSYQDEAMTVPLGMCYFMYLTAIPEK